MPVYFVLMTVFTIGEVFSTLGKQPYMTRRIPSSHWGRVNSFVNIVYGAFPAIGNVILGKVIDSQGYNAAWLLVGAAGAVTIVLSLILALNDRRSFPLLYEPNAATSQSPQEASGCTFGPH